MEVVIYSFNNDLYHLVYKVHGIIKNGKSHSNLGTTDVILIHCKKNC